MIRTRLEHHITEHTSEKELRNAMDMFDCYNVPDHGEMKRAQYKLDNYWKVKTGTILNPHLPRGPVHLISLSTGRVHFQF